MTFNERRKFCLYGKLLVFPKSQMHTFGRNFFWKIKCYFKSVIVNFLVFFGQQQVWCVALCYLNWYAICYYWHRLINGEGSVVVFELDTSESLLTEWTVKLSARPILNTCCMKVVACITRKRGNMVLADKVSKANTALQVLVKPGSIDSSREFFNG